VHQCQLPFILLHLILSRVVLLSQLALLFHHYGDRRFNHHLNCRYQALCLWLLMPCSVLALWWLDCTSSLLEVSLSIFLCLPDIVILAALPHNVENIIIHFTLQRLKNWPPCILFFYLPTINNSQKKQHPTTNLCHSQH
jgi:hypothetical protein